MKYCSSSRFPSDPVVGDPITPVEEVEVVTFPFPFIVDVVPYSVSVSATFDVCLGEVIVLLIVFLSSSDWCCCCCCCYSGIVPGVQTVGSAAQEPSTVGDGRHLPVFGVTHL